MRPGATRSCATSGSIPSVSLPRSSDAALRARRRASRRTARKRVERLGVRGRYLFYPAQFWAHKNHATLFEASRRSPAMAASPTSWCSSDPTRAARHTSSPCPQRRDARARPLSRLRRDRDLVALYQHAHALTYLSFFGPENLPPLEAFALGCPVIAATCPARGNSSGMPPLSSRRPTRSASRRQSVVWKIRRSGTSSIELGRAPLSSTPEAYVDGVMSFLDEFELTRRCWA